MKIFKIAVPIPFEEDWGQTKKPIAYEKLDSTVTQDGVDEIQKRYPNAKPLSGGWFGLVYDIGNDKVLKVTLDQSEFTMASDLIETPSDLFVDVYEVDQKFGDRGRYWTIVLEKIKPLNRNQKSTMLSILEKFRVFMAYMQRKGEQSEIENWRDFVWYLKDNGYLEEIKDKEFFMKFYDFIEKLLESGISWYKSDIHNNNVGFDKDGNIVILDLGGINQE